MNEQRICKRGHLVAGGNVYIQPNGYKQCRICRNSAKMASYNRTTIKREPKIHCKNGHILEGDNLCQDVLPKRRCRICRNAYMRNRTLSLRNERDEKFSRQIREFKLKEKYGITLETKEQLIAGQSNKCAICASEFSDTNKPCVDHDHKNKKVRGILCHPCNRAIGLLKDDPVVLTKAADYLNKSRTEGV